MPDSEMIRQYRAARRVGVPIVAINTPDPAATMRAILGASASNGDIDTPVMRWDIVSALTGLNPAGEQAMRDSLPMDPVTGQKMDASQLNSPITVLGEVAPRFPGAPRDAEGNAIGFGSVLIALGVHRMLDSEAMLQAIWNLRDPFKASLRTLVLLGPSFTFPPELSGDVLILDEPLPDTGELARIVTTIHADAKAPVPDESLLEKSTDALAGLAAFPSEQAVALTLVLGGRQKPLDTNALWERKRRMIGATPGLSVWRGGETFSDVRGCSNVLGFMSDVLRGRMPPRAVVFIDEIEKAVAGAGTDTSGVSQSLLGTLLTWMQDREATGTIFIGPPGAAKSLVAKAVGGEGNIPTIAFDLSGMKASLVGQSEERMRAALAVVDAVAQGSALFVATCNAISVLPPELIRRFKFGTFFFDLPDAEERAAIWQLYCQRYEITDDPGSVDHDGWTGAEIKQCCELAYRLNQPLVGAAAFVTPVAVTAAEKISKLRTEADGRYTSASYPGLYHMNRPSTPRPGKREFNWDDGDK